MTDKKYYCLRCQKFHDMDYNVHKNFAFDVENVAKMENRLYSLENKINDLIDKFNELLEILRVWHIYMEWHHPYYNDDSNKFTLEKFHVT